MAVPPRRYESPESSGVFGCVVSLRSRPSVALASPLLSQITADMEADKIQNYGQKCFHDITVLSI